jgi:hypothetical protein
MAAVSARRKRASRVRFSIRVLGLTLATDVDGLVWRIAVGQWLNQVPKPAWREVFIRGLQLLDAPPSMLPHKSALELIPSAGVDIGVRNPDQVKPLMLMNWPTIDRMREGHIADPHLLSNGYRLHAALFREFSAQRVRVRFTGIDAASRRNPERFASAAVGIGAKQEHAILRIQENRADRGPF